MLVAHAAYHRQVTAILNRNESCEFRELLFPVVISPGTRFLER